MKSKLLKAFTLLFFTLIIIVYIVYKSDDYYLPFSLNRTLREIGYKTDALIGKYNYEKTPKVS